MGGFNSGRRAKTPETDDCLKLSLSKLRREGLLRRCLMAQQAGSWHFDVVLMGRVTIVADIECLEPNQCLRLTDWAFGQRIDQLLEIVSQPQPFGGERFYLFCPVTGRRCTVLFLPANKSYFASARGWDLPYASTREREAGGALRVIHKVETQSDKMSKYTRRPTHDRMAERWGRAQNLLDTYEARIMRWW